MSEIGEIIVDMDNNNIMKNSDIPAEEPPILHTKKFRIGSGNIIGKGVIQDFFTCAGAFLLWVVLSSIELVVLRTLLPCL